MKSNIHPSNTYQFQLSVMGPIAHLFSKKYYQEIFYVALASGDDPERVWIVIQEPTVTFIKYLQLSNFATHSSTASYSQMPILRQGCAVSVFPKPDVSFDFSHLHVSACAPFQQRALIGC